MLSKETMSKILNIDVKKFVVNTNTVSINCDQKRDNSCVVCEKHINIYELEYLCKEYIAKQDYYISSFIDFGIVGNFCQIKWYSPHLCLKTFSADTSPEAVFAACEWMETNKKLSIL